MNRVSFGLIALPDLTDRDVSIASYGRYTLSLVPISKKLLDDAAAFTSDAAREIALNELSLQDKTNTVCRAADIGLRYTHGFEQERQTVTCEFFNLVNKVFAYVS